MLWWRVHPKLSAEGRLFAVVDALLTLVAVPTNGN